jgi:hypothetical protein
MSQSGSGKLLLGLQHTHSWFQLHRTHDRNLQFHASEFVELLFCAYIRGSKIVVFLFFSQTKKMITIQKAKGHSLFDTSSTLWLTLKVRQPLYSLDLKMAVLMIVEEALIVSSTSCWITRDRQKKLEM